MAVKLSQVSQLDTVQPIRGSLAVVIFFKDIFTLLLRLTISFTNGLGVPYLVKDFQKARGLIVAREFST